MASFTNVGDSVSISAIEKDTPIVVNISGTYDMVIAVQREVRNGSGAFEEVERYTAANAVVEEIFWSDREDQKFQLIVLSDISGTATATIEIGDILGQAPDTEHTHTLSDITDAGTAAAADTGTSPGNVPVLDSSGRLPAVDGSQLTGLAGGGDMVAATFDPQGVNGDAFARANHTGTQAISTITGLQTAIDSKAGTAHAHVLADITDAGTAAAADIGTGSGNVPVLDGSGRLPAVDGSQLTNLPSGGSAGPDLTAVEGLTTTGIAVRTAADTWTTRQVNGTFNQINVTNGDGVSGNITVSAAIAPSSFAQAGTDNILLMTPLRTAQAIEALTFPTKHVVRVNGSVKFRTYNDLSPGGSVAVPTADSSNTGEWFGVYFRNGASTPANLTGGLTETFSTPNQLRTFYSNGSAWIEFERASSGGAGNTPNVVRLTGGSEAPTLAGYNDALVIIDSGTQTLTAPGSGADVYYFRGVNKSGNAATIGGVSVPDGETFSVLVDGTSMTVRTTW